MSKLDTLSGNAGDCETTPSEQELNVSPSWSSIQNITFSLGVHSPFKAKPRPKVTAPQALLSPPLLDSYFDSPRAKEYSFNWRAAEEQEFDSPVSQGFGEAEAIGCEAQAASNLRNSFMESCSGKYCPLDRIETELQQSSSSDVTQDDQVGQMDLAFQVPDNGEGEGIREACSENTGDGEWEGVVKLVQELTTRFTDSKQCTGNAGTENVQQETDKLAEQHPSLQTSAQTPAQAQALKGLEALNKGPSCDGSADDIMMALSTIQRNVEKIKAVVPRIASRRAKFTLLVQRQCAAAAGAIKLMSQLADAAIAIVPEIQRQVEGVSSESCQSSDRCNENSPISPNDPPVSSVLRGDGEIAESPGIVGSLAPTLAAIPISPASIITVKPLTEESIDAAERAATASELLRTENECASSLVADLLGPCGRVTGSDGFAAQVTATSTPFRLEQWQNEIEEALGTDCCSQLKSGPLRLENPGDESPSRARGDPGEVSTSRAAGAGGSDAEPTPCNAYGASAQDESDEGDTRGGDQLPMGSFTLMEIDDLEILTEQTHYCNICSKGFKRDANLRMHMRSHGGKYKSSTALIRSERAPKIAQEMVGGKPTRYSCPYEGCSRNMKHPKFQALKTMLCLKNHYRRSHCAKTLKCSICKSKQFSVVADLKTHEKHCGSDKWACSCGTTFSRKEKLYGHVSLFVGHVPVDASAVGPEVGTSAVPTQVQLITNKDGSSAQNVAMNAWQDW